MNDEELWSAFGACTLTHAQWTHQAHVRMACLFLLDCKLDLDEAHLRMRAGIIRLNERHGLMETSARGYFETLTRVWLVLVLAALKTSGAVNSQQLLARSPQLMQRELPLKHYSQAVLNTVRARSIFVEPDLAPLP